MAAPKPIIAFQVILPGSFQGSVTSIPGVRERLPGVLPGATCLKSGPTIPHQDVRNPHQVAVGMAPANSRPARPMACDERSTGRAEEITPCGAMVISRFTTDLLGVVRQGQSSEKDIVLATAFGDATAAVAAVRCVNLLFWKRDR